MKRLVVGLLVTVCTLLLVGVVLGPAAPVKAEKPAMVKGEEYHHLLMLDVREAVEHAKALHFYAQKHATHLDKAVMTKHLDELTKNMDGVHTNLADLEQNIDAAEKAKMEAQITSIRADEAKALPELDLLKAEIAKPEPSATVIAEKAKAIYVDMSAMQEHHRKAMVKRGVTEPKEPTKP